MTNELHVPAELERLEQVRTWVVSQLVDAGVDRPHCIDVELAVGEAVANVVRHTFAETEGSLDIAVDITDGVLTIVITDDGPPWDGSRSLPATDGGGGYGLALIEDVMDDVEHRALVPTGNRLTLGKRVFGG